MSLSIRRGTDAERQTITPLEGEYIYTTDQKEVWIGDGATVGGNPVSAYIDLQTNSTSNGTQTILNLVDGSNISIVDDGLGNVTISGTANPIVLQINGINNYDQSTLNLIEGNGITITDDGLGGAIFDVTDQTLQQVTDAGNTTTNDIDFGTGAGLLFDNGARVREGTTDGGLGGNKGVALRCSIDYEYKWEAGRRYVMEQNGITIREVAFTFTDTPTITDDDTLGYVIGSRWILDNGDVYTCSDATTGAAVWDLTATGTNKDLQHLTASGTDTYTATALNYTAYADGDAFIIRFTNGNTDTSTLNINGLGAVSLYSDHNGLMVGGDIHDESELLVVYNASSPAYFKCIGSSPNTLFAYVTNADSVTITKGQPVYAFGATGNRMTVKLAANTSDATSAKTIGVVFSSSIAANQKGFIIIQGTLSGINLGSYTAGDTLYLGSTAGTFTNVKPYAPNHLVYVGIVERANAGNGIMYVRVQNGYELEEIHDVDLITTPPVDGDVLTYDAYTSLWVPAAIPPAGVTSVGATTPITSSGGTTPTISTSMATNKLIGRGTAGTGVMEEITLGTNLSLSGTTLNATTPTNTNLDQIFIEANGQGGVVQPGYTGVVNVTASGTITGWTIYSINPSTGAALSGSIDIDVLSDSSFIPTTSLFPIAANRPKLSSATNNSTTGLSIAVVAGDKIRARVISATTCVLVNLQLQITRS